jgi:hypothetical protein
MKNWARIDGALSDYVDVNWLRESLLKRRLREDAAGGRALLGPSEPTDRIAGPLGLAFIDADKDADAAAFRALNAKLKGDRRIDLASFAVGDGMTRALKR